MSGEEGQILLTYCEENSGWATELAAHFDRQKINTFRRQIPVGQGEDQRVRFVYWLPLISKDTFRSIASVVTIDILFEELEEEEEVEEPMSRVLPVFIGENLDLDLQRLRTLMPLVARQTPLVITVNKLKDELSEIPKLVQQRLEHPFTYAKSVLFSDERKYQELWCDILWEKTMEEVEVNVNKTSNTLGIDVEYIRESFAEDADCAVCVKKSDQPQLSPGDRLLEVMGLPISGKCFVRNVKLLIEQNYSLRFKKRPCTGTEAEFKANLAAFRKRNEEINRIHEKKKMERARSQRWQLPQSQSQRKQFPTGYMSKLSKAKSLEQSKPAALAYHRSASLPQDGQKPMIILTRLT